MFYSVFSSEVNLYVSLLMQVYREMNKSQSSDPF